MGRLFLFSKPHQIDFPMAELCAGGDGERSVRDAPARGRDSFGFAEQPLMRFLAAFAFLPKRFIGDAGDPAVLDIGIDCLGAESAT